MNTNEDKTNIKVQTTALKIVLNEMEGLSEQDLAEFLKIEFSDILDLLSGVRPLTPSAFAGLQWLVWLWHASVNHVEHIKPEQVKKFVREHKFEGEMTYTKLGLTLFVGGL